MNKLIGVGAALVDCLAHVPESFLDSLDGAKGGMELIDYPLMRKIMERLPAPPVRAPGGSSANTIMAYARLGGAAAMLAKTGDDDQGRFYREQFMAAGVDLSSFKEQAGVATGTCLSLITPDGQRTMRSFLGASATLHPGEIAAADFAGCRHLHIEGYLLFNQELLVHALRLAREAGCRISLDLGAPEVVAGARRDLPRLLADYVDMVFANQDEAVAYCGSQGDDPEPGLRELSKACPWAAVKLGADGVMISHRDELVRVPGLRVQVVDTTGAGDLWAAGFLYGLAHGYSLKRAGELGNRLGAEVVQTTGTTLDQAIWAGIRKDFLIE